LKKGPIEEAKEPKCVVLWDPSGYKRSLNTKDEDTMKKSDRN